METFIERLERLIKESHTTQAALADSIGLRRTTISDWKRNGSYPSADVAVRIAERLNTSVEYLVTGTEKNTAAVELKALKEKLAGLIR